MKEGEKQGGWIMHLRNETELLLCRIITHQFQENSVLAQQSLEAADVLLYVDPMRSAERNTLK